MERNLCAQQTAALVSTGSLLPHQSASAKCPCIPTTPRGLGLGQGPQGSEKRMGMGSWGGASISIHWPVFSSLLFGSPLSSSCRGMTLSWLLPLWGHQLQITCGGLLVEKGGREMSQGCGRIHSGSHGTDPGHGQQGGCWHRGPVSQTGRSLLADAMVSQWRARP